MQRLTILVLTFVLLGVFLIPLSVKAAGDDKATYSREEIAAEVEGFFEGATQGLADIVEKVFEDQGRPNGFIKGGATVSVMP